MIWDPDGTLHGAHGAVGPAAGSVVGVVGARGGAGASVLAAALAHRASTRGSASVVDLDGSCGGLDVLLGIEEERGVRWPDLVAAQGVVAGEDLAALLPRWGRCAVLSADRSRAEPPEPAVVRDVVAALRSAFGLVVLDLDRAAGVAGGWPWCDALVVVVPRDLRAVAGGVALRVAVAAADVPAGIVVGARGRSGLAAAEVGEAVGLPVIAAVRRSRAVADAVERGFGPVVGGRGRPRCRSARSGRAVPLGNAAERVLAWLEAGGG